MIGIVDYNMGNLASVKNAFSLLGEEVEVVHDPDAFMKYEKLILPGVGAFCDAMEHLQERAMVDGLHHYAQSGNYMLGICLGMQLLFESSEEFGSNEGLALIKGHVQAFDEKRFDTPLKVPHMGWNRMFSKKHPLFENLDEEHYLYFVHSFHAVCENPEDTIGRTEYGYSFTSAVAHENVLGIQPHPEKSHKNGLQILKNFINL